MKKLFLIAILVVLISCEKDDICAEGTPTTPQLILEFFDVSDPDTLKNVSQLFVYGLDDADQPMVLAGQSVSNKSQVTVPLRTNVDLTKSVFHMDYEVDDNGTPDDDSDDIVLGNPEVVHINYTREDVYVSRACGYKTIFNGLTATLQPDADNWILNITIENETVENETVTHVKIFH